MIIELKNLLIYIYIYIYLIVRYCIKYKKTKFRVITSKNKERGSLKLIYDVISSSPGEGPDEEKALRCTLLFPPLSAHSLFHPFRLFESEGIRGLTWHCLLLRRDLQLSLSSHSFFSFFSSASRLSSRVMSHSMTTPLLSPEIATIPLIWYFFHSVI